LPWPTELYEEQGAGGVLLANLANSVFATLSRNINPPKPSCSLGNAFCLKKLDYTMADLVIRIIQIYKSRALLNTEILGKFSSISLVELWGSTLQIVSPKKLTGTTLQSLNPLLRSHC